MRGTDGISRERMVGTILGCGAVRCGHERSAAVRTDCGADFRRVSLSMALSTRAPAAVKRLFAILLIAACFAGATPVSAQETGVAALGAAIDRIGVGARVLVVAAHPDDEDTQLIAWLARGRSVETAYLSLTRGDGGQNLIGPELGEALGVIRTEELLAARRVDGGLQFFSRAYDFGYSRSAAETFTHWPRDSVLRDVVTVVRAFRPHVIVAVFSGTGRDGHGHHQAAGMLAREAYEMAGDTVRMPRGIHPDRLAPWTPLKLYQAQRFRPDGATLANNVGAFDPLFGRSYAEIAAISRSQHRSQGFGALERRGVVMNHLRREHSRVPAPADASAERSIFDGIDLELPDLIANAGVSSSGPVRAASVHAALDAVRAASLRQPDTIAARIAALLPLLEASPAAGGGAADGLARAGVREALEGARRRAEDALAIASGAVAEAEVGREVIATGTREELRFTVYNRGGHTMEVMPPRIFGCSADGGPEPGFQADSAVTLMPDSARTWTGTLCAPAEPTQPWWLEQPREGGMFRVPIRPEPEHLVNRGPHLAASVRLTPREGYPPATFRLETPVVHRFVDPVFGDVRRPVAFAPAISVLLDGIVEFAVAGRALDRELRVRLRSAAADEQGVAVHLELPAGLTAEPASRDLVLPADATRDVTFRIRGTPSVGQHSIRAVVESGGQRFRTGYVLVEYDHIRPQRMYRPASVALEAVDVRVPDGFRVGYVPGVADNVAPTLAQLGIDVTLLDPAALATAELARFDAVVVGPRAYGASSDLVENNSRLLDYLRAGGTMVVQYGQWEMMREGITPFPLSIRRPHDRVTDHTAPMRVLDPSDPVLRSPNRITDADFDGWVQERGLYMPWEFDPAYRPLFETSDPDQPSNRGAVLVARYGAGTYVFTSLAFFRQLPAGVPGAARLFVNLLTAGRDG